MYIFEINGQGKFSAGILNYMAINNLAYTNDNDKSQSRLYLLIETFIARLQIFGS